MGLSEPAAIREWLRRQGHEGPERPHVWIFLHPNGEGDAANDGDAAVRALCNVCGLIRRKPLSTVAEIFIDLGGPCPGDSSYWRELQERRAVSAERDRRAAKRR